MSLLLNVYTTDHCNRSDLLVKMISELIIVIVTTRQKCVKSCQSSDHFIG